MLKTNLCDYSNAYICNKGIITIPNTGTTAATSVRSMKWICNNCAPFTDSISEIDHTQVNNAQ